ncbi:MAG: response regulator transcription factor [Gammaproteobacteria bacterium]|nr:response regulator transcription factor [Gammaproteobacteria bacterium]
MQFVVVDDHELFREGLKMLIASLYPGANVVEAGSIEEFLDLKLEDKEIDLVLFDLNLPGRSDVDALVLLRKTLPSVPIVVMSANENPSKVGEVFRYAIQGYIPKSSDTNIIKSAINLVLEGGAYLPPQLLAAGAIDSHSAQHTNTTHVAALTPRQLDVLQELKLGKTNKEIGKALSLTESTVRAHVAAILRAFNAKNRTQVVQKILNNR